MLYFKLENGQDLAAAAQAMTDGKKAFRIWEGDTARTYDRRGLCTACENSQADADAVALRPDMDADALRNAHRIAAARETVRTKERRAADLLAMYEKPGIMLDYVRRELLALVNVAYHSSGKIEGCHSVDGCASCEFCQKMISAAGCNPLMICGSCYAARDAWKEIAWRTHTLNARILSTVLFTAEELATLALGALCRINEDGDTVNDIHARNILRIILTHPHTHFGYWYKNAPAVAAGLAAEGYTDRASLPDNVRFVHSSALIGFRVRPCWFDDYTFTVYPDAATVAEAVAAGAWECNGRRCRDCKYHCYTGPRTAEVIDTAELLRCSKPDRVRILAAYWDRRRQQESRQA